ncbi:Chromosome partition protein Smc [Corynebacterium glaucum]|uniref:Chromosome partition protein Smc n=1 Tax=Corynebacterium glaucum TaxID=187491 RepID=A0A1Q2HT59_9CORY|nr:YhgE/Pip domain-containing protein [Corynebacterium glaucum]AQQ14026.1 Chromosome partition protein Smc [Corynebacterium glaucum]
MSGLHIGTNFRKFFHGTLPPLALIAIALLPLLFGGLFVWSYFDPLGNFHKVPVALVNSDEGDAGQKVVDELVAESPMDFHVVSADEAREGVENGTYYLAMELPTDFTDAATSVQSDNPRQAKINVTLNETNGFIPTMLGSTATTQVAEAVSHSIGAEVVNQLFVGFNTIGDGMDQAKDGASQLDDGAQSAKDGAGQLDDGAGRLNDGLNEFNEKAQQLPEAAGELDNGVSELQNGAQQLNENLGTAADGAQQLSDGLGKLKTATDTLGSGAEQVAGGVDKIADLAGTLSAAQQAYEDIDSSLAQVIEDLDRSPIPGSELIAEQARATRAQLNSGTLGAAAGSDLVSQLTLLQDGAHQVAYQLHDPESEYLSGMNTAVGAAETLAKGLAALDEGSGTLLAGVTKLKDGTSAFVVAANAAADATSKLAEGSDQLVVGMGELSDGLVQLSDGTGELSLKLSEGAEKAPRWEGERLDMAVENASNPVVVNQVGDELTFFGRGLSPFFLSLSLWFGGLIMFMVLPPLSRRAIDSGALPTRVALNTLVPAYLIGLAQVIALWVVQVFVLDVQPKHPGWLFAVLMFASWAFITTIFALNAVFGASVGRLITMALMSLQLVASNGLYPPEVQPEFIQWVHKLDPMTYVVDLTRFALFGSAVTDPRMHRAVIVLVALAIGSWLVSCLGLRALRRPTEKDIYPEISV